MKKTQENIKFYKKLKINSIFVEQFHINFFEFVKNQVGWPQDFLEISDE